MDIEFTLPVQQVSTGKYSILVNVEGVNSEKILSNAIFYFLPSNIVNIDNRCQYRLLWTCDELSPSPTAFSILRHFPGYSLLLSHLSPIAILYRILHKSIPLISMMSYLRVISIWNMKRPRKMYFSCRIPKHITLNDVIMVTGVIGVRDILA